MGYVIIVGGQLHNKGAQAMTFTVVDNIKKRYPNREVVLFSAVYSERDEKEKEVFNFEVLHWPMRAKMKILGFQTAQDVGNINYLKYLIKGTGISGKSYKYILDILKNTDLMIDISGYALSSQRGYLSSLNYLYNIKVAKQYNIPVLLFPQSFGPFNYTTKESKLIMPLIKDLLQYPEAIYAREHEGLEYLKELNLKNVEHCYDSVLQGEKKFLLENIYKANTVKEVRESTRVNIPINSVAIVPNEKVMKHGDETEQYKIYSDIIDKLLEEEKNIYLIRHSFEDLKICQHIKKMYNNHANVILLEDDYSCIQIDSIISQFEFIIASRYHAIIHAYKNGVPALVFGWAIKYKEVLAYFSQEKYLFDVRASNDEIKVLEALRGLINDYSAETELISAKMKKLERVDLFNKITL